MKEAKVGRLTKVKHIGDLVWARCDCGWSIVMVAEEWGEKYGCCGEHHNEAVRERKQAKAEEEQRVAREEQVAKDTDRFINPHWEDLDKSQQLMVATLDQYSPFTAETIMKLFNLDVTAAKEELTSLLMHNVLIELVGHMRERRPYTMEPYSWKASLSSPYIVRPEIKEKVAALGVKALAVKEEKPLRAWEKRGIDEGDLQDFLMAKCVMEAKGTVKQALLRAEYFKWCEENGLQPIDGDSFVMELSDHLNMDLDAHGRWVGVRLKRAKDLEPFKMAGPTKQELADAEYQRLMA